MDDASLAEREPQLKGAAGHCGVNTGKVPQALRGRETERERDGDREGERQTERRVIVV